MKKLLFLVTFFLTSCAAADLSNVSSMALCEELFNTPSIYINERAHMDELSKRNEDCSRFEHLRKPTLDIEVN